MTTLQHAQNEIAKRHLIQDDITHTIGHLSDWQQDLETGPDDDAETWQLLLASVIEAQRLLRYLNAHLHALPVDPVAWEQTYGELD